MLGSTSPATNAWRSSTTPICLRKRIFNILCELLEEDEEVCGRFAKLRLWLDLEELAHFLILAR